MIPPGNRFLSTSAFFIEVVITVLIPFLIAWFAALVPIVAIGMSLGWMEDPGRQGKSHCGDKATEGKEKSGRGRYYNANWIIG